MVRLQDRKRCDREMLRKSLPATATDKMVVRHRMSPSTFEYFDHDKFVVRYNYILINSHWIHSIAWSRAFSKTLREAELAEERELAMRVIAEYQRSADSRTIH